MVDHKLLDRRLVAIVFTDMVGYTALIQADERDAVAKRDRYWAALDRHHDRLGGTIVQRLGDGSMSMFPSSLSALHAAVSIQQELANEGVSVRVGVHVGEVVVEQERLTGEAVNIAARIESFAVPGGVMLSDSAYDQIKNRGEIDVVSLGRFRLKNVGRPYELYAVAAEGLVVPDARTLEGKGERFVSLPSTLPESTVNLFGRADDLVRLAELTEDHAVVTVTGPGGVGKTRVLVELGWLLAPKFLDGVAFVALADVTEPANFIPKLAETLDVKEAEGRSLEDGVATLIDSKKALLLLDNFEQIVAAAPAVARLTERCPELRVVTSSRTPLRIAAEREYALAPLAVPPSSEVEATDSLVAYPGVALFVERATKAKGAFELTDDNAQTVADICRRLDGLPLAIELAAARLRLLTPEGLRDRLHHALDALGSGQRDAPVRQQTLRATIDWSHSLLTEGEQRLFRRLAVFADGCAFADLEAVCSIESADPLDELESLVDKALVRIDEQGDRFRMLQTIAEYARERLDASTETDELLLRHARRYADVARAIRDGSEGTELLASVRRGAAEEANLQTALDTLLAAATAGDIDACQIGLRMSGDLLMYWHIRGKNVTAREYAAAFLAADRDAAPTAARASALTTAGLASWAVGQFDRANDEWAEAYRIATEVGAERELCVSAWAWAVGLIGFDLDRGLKLAAESVERSRALGFAWAEGLASTVDGILHTVAGDLEGAQRRYSYALDLQRRIHDDEGAGLSLGGLAQLASIRGELPASTDLYLQSLAAFEAIGDRAEEARILSELAWTRLQQGNSSDARRAFLGSAQAYTDVASVRGVGLALIGLAATDEVEQRPARAVQIAAAAEVYAAEEGIVNVYSDETPGREYVERARAALSGDEASSAADAGRALTIAEALELARAPR
ncbi:MAG TPA: adenylate/guanylate cyclase domain-containing protein [Gaiellaceae bacterium]|nr:adenylate/guanylate cyclase domain-containing protein [Gaiellaceae bacterium]